MTTLPHASWQMPAVTPLDRTGEAALRARIDGKAKPLGALGRIEDLAVQLGMIWQPSEPARRQRACCWYSPATTA